MTGDPAAERAWRRLFDVVVSERPFVAWVDAGPHVAVLEQRLIQTLRLSGRAVVAQTIDAVLATPLAGAVQWFVVDSTDRSVDALTAMVERFRLDPGEAVGLVVIGAPAHLHAETIDLVSLADATSEGVTVKDVVVDDLDALIEVIADGRALASVDRSEAGDVDGLIGVAIEALEDDSFMAGCEWLLLAVGRAGDDSPADLRPLSILTSVEARAGDLAAMSEHGLELLDLAGDDAAEIGIPLLTQLTHAGRSLGDHRLVLRAAAALHDAYGALAADPEVDVEHADLFSVQVGCRYFRGEALDLLGRTDEAIAVFSAVLASFDDAPPQVQDDAGSQGCVADVALALVAILQLRRDGEAEIVLQQAVDRQRGLVDRMPEATSPRSQLASLYVRLGDQLAEQDDPLAVACYDEAVTIERQLCRDVGPDPIQLDSLGVALGRLGRERSRLGDLDEAAAAFEEGVAISAAVLSLHRDLRLLRNRKVALGDLAGCYRRLGRIAEAWPHRWESLDLSRQAVAADPHSVALLDDLTVDLVAIGFDLAAEGRLDEAVPLGVEAEQIGRDILRRTGPTERALASLAGTCLDLANWLREAGRLADAADLYRESIALRREAVTRFGANPRRSRKLSTALRVYGRLVAQAEGAAAAEASLSESLHIARDLAATTPTSETTNELADSLVDLASSYFERHLVTLALELYREAHETLLADASPIPTDSFRRQRVALVTSNLATALARGGHLDEAIPLLETLREERAALAERLGTNQPLRGLALTTCNLVSHLCAAGYLDRARVRLDDARRAVDAFAEQNVEGTVALPLVWLLVSNEGTFAATDGRPAAAAAAHRDAFEIAGRYLAATDGSSAAASLCNDAARAWARAVLSDEHLDPRGVAAPLDVAIDSARSAGLAAPGSRNVELGDALALRARVRDLVSNGEGARTDLDEALVAFGVGTAEDDPNTDVWRWQLEALALALDLDVGVIGGVDDGTLAEVTTRLVRATGDVLGQHADAMRAAVDAQATLVRWQHRRGDDPSGAQHELDELRAAGRARFPELTGWGQRGLTESNNRR